VSLVSGTSFWAQFCGYGVRRAEVYGVRLGVRLGVSRLVWAGRKAARVEGMSQGGRHEPGWKA
jgi:hypothetical protein